MWVDYLQILQVHLKSTAKPLKLGYSWMFLQGNDPTHIQTVLLDKAG